MLSDQPMSAVGQKQTSLHIRVVSALHAISKSAECQKATLLVPQQRQHQWHSRGGEGAVHSTKSARVDKDNWSLRTPMSIKDCRVLAHAD